LVNNCERTALISTIDCIYLDIWVESWINFKLSAFSYP